FRLAHVYFGRETIEVATFRASSAPSQAEEPLQDADPQDGEGQEIDEPLESELDSETVPNVRASSLEPSTGGQEPDDRAFDLEGERILDASGRIVRDNVYGTIDEDVWRRDFTANALYYNIADFSLWDYTSGVEDVAARRLRLIGDPETRYREDPVRMLRAAR